jgi:hypothetical protein
MNLNNDQLYVLDKLTDFLSGYANRIALVGGGGVGKTTVINQLLGKIQHSHTVCVCAPTHRSLRVIKSSIEYPTVEYKTIHSLLGLVPISNKDLTELEQKGKSKVSDFDLLIIDESSMLGKSLLSKLDLAQQGSHTKIIFVGDDYQAPPVGEVQSLAFKDITTLRLTKVERTKGCVLDLCIQTRKWIDDNHKPTKAELLSFCVVEEEKSVSECDYNTFNQALVAHSMCMTTENTDYSKAIAWTNRACTNMGNTVRKAQGYDTRINYNQGEIIVLRKALTEMQTLVGYNPSLHAKEGSDEILLPIGSELEVLYVKENPPLLIDAYQINSTTNLWDEFKLGSNRIIARCLGTGDEYEFNVAKNLLEHETILSEMNNLCKKHRMGNPAYEYARRINEFVSAPQIVYSGTAHSVQGSTYDIVFINVSDILSAERYNGLQTALKLLYVAFSRAKNHIVMTM